MTKLVISRDKLFVDRNRKYKVMRDKECLGEIRDGETLIFDVPHGKQEIYFKLDWMRSNKIALDPKRRDEIKIRTGCNMTGMKALLTVLCVFLTPSKYLYAVRED